MESVVWFWSEFFDHLVKSVNMTKTITIPEHKLVYHYKNFHIINIKTNSQCTKFI
jgi:ribosomal protein S17